MTGTMGQIRAALGMAPIGIPNLNCYQYTPDAVAEPCFYPGEVAQSRIGGGNTFGSKAQGGQREYEIVCTVLVSRSDDAAGQALLDRYLSEGDDWSIIDAIEADRTLEGMCNTLHVTALDGYRLYTVGNDRFYGARLRVRVNA